LHENLFAAYKLTDLEDTNVKVRSTLTKDFSNSAVRSKYSVEWKTDID